MDDRLREILSNVMEEQGTVTVLTGAGISAESGIPTFRGKEGYWTVGAREYHPQEMATQSMFLAHPWEVWRWYLYRLGVCKAAGPNAGHRAVADMEERLGNRFRLITQNVDGLHLEAGNSHERTYQIHGNIAYMRCFDDCSRELVSTPVELTRTDKAQSLAEHEQTCLLCSRCQAKMRPHVLWFDECYDEAYYKMESSMDWAINTDLLIVVGTSGATSLPMRIGGVVASRGAAIVDVNPSDNPFAQLARASSRGMAITATACERLPEMAKHVS